RTSAGTYTHLHLIKLLGSSTDDKMLKRAFLDYWNTVNMNNYENIEEFFATSNGIYYLLTKFVKNTYSDFDFTNVAKVKYFFFCRETTGLPDWVKDKYQDTALRIPMNDNIRSLNLSNTASLLIYEALRQQNFPSLY